MCSTLIMSFHYLHILATLYCKSLSHAQLFATPWMVARQASLSMEFSSQEYWRGLSFPPPGVSFQPMVYFYLDHLDLFRSALLWSLKGMRMEEGSPFLCFGFLGKRPATLPLAEDFQKAKFLSQTSVLAAELLSRDV